MVANILPSVSGGAILASAIGAVVFTMILEGIKRLVNWLRLRRVRAFWRPWIRDDDTLIFAATQDYDDTNSFAMGYYDLASMEKIRSYLDEVSPTAFDPETNAVAMEPQWTNKDIILIGGPANNQITETVLEDGTGTEYTFDGNSICDGTGSIVRSPDNPAESGTDAGVISKIPNPKGDGEVLNIAGCYGPGVLGGTYLMRDNLDDIRDVVDTDYFQLLYDVDVSNETNQPVAWEVDEGEVNEIETGFT